jgi:phage terminase small subunit
VRAQALFLFPALTDADFMSCTMKFDEIYLAGNMPKKLTKAETKKEERLPDQQATFCVHYVNNGFVGWRAAESAGYKGERNSLYATASRLLSNVKIRAEIDRLMKAKHVGRDELLTKLAEMVHVDMREFAGLSIEALKKHPKAFLLKKIKHRKTKDGEEYTEVESYSSLEAIELLMRHLKMLSSGAGESPDNPLHLRIDDMADIFRMVQAHKESQS